MIRVSVALLTSSQAGGQHSSLARFKVSGSNYFVNEDFCDTLLHTRASASCPVHVRSVADWQALIRLVSDVTLLTGSPAALCAWQDACTLHHGEQSERVLGHACSLVIMACRSRRVLSS